MIIMKWHSVAWGAALGALTLATTATAAERLPYVGMEYYIADPADIVQLEERHAVILGRWNGTFESEDQSSPMHHDTIDCVGMVDARPDGSWDASGYCMNTDREGDQ